jgi:hypothetical protein
VSDAELLPKSKEEPVRRLEVFTDAGRRRAWTPEQKDLSSRLARRLDVLVRVLLDISSTARWRA